MNELTRNDLSEMILRLAHGIRNPLATIKTGVQLVKHLSEPNLEVEEYLDSALESVERIDSIVIDLQRYVALGPTSPEIINFERLIEEAIGNCKAQSLEKNQSIQINFRAQGAIRIDRVQMVLCIQELIQNALEHTEKGKDINLILDRSKEGMLQMHVDDACGGIDPDLSPKILRPFFSTSRSGTGLGLSIVSKFIEMSGGTVTIQFQHGPGCRFTVALPEV